MILDKTMLWHIYGVKLHHRIEDGLVETFDQLQSEIAQAVIDSLEPEEVTDRREGEDFLVAVEFATSRTLDWLARYPVALFTEDAK